MHLHRSLYSILAVTFFACLAFIINSSSDANESANNSLFFLQAVGAENRVSLMSFNVENLFDTEHDEGKNDYAFLPLEFKQSRPDILEFCKTLFPYYRRRECLDKDWSQEVLTKKLERVADVIQQINGGRGPDILILEEVENQRALEMLAAYLPLSGYQTRVLLEGPDYRGIDNAVMSRLPQWDYPRLHIIPFQIESPKEEFAAQHTRGILETRLILPNGEKASVFALHFPSQSNPSYLRQQAAVFVSQLAHNLPADVLPIVGGDFNIVPDEEATHRVYDYILGSVWMVTHLVGCQDCIGTNYYHPKRQWSFLDAMLFPKTMVPGPNVSNWKLDTTSIRTPNASRYQNNKHGSPARFNPKSSIGVSDHWPIYAEIYLQ